MNHTLETPGRATDPAPEAASRGAHRNTAPVRWHRPLLWAGWAFTALVLASLIGLLIDDRTLLGEPVWIKVLKFAFSFAAYTFTLAWLIGRMTRARRFGWWTGTVFAVLGVIEVGVLTSAAAQGTYSHFNQSAEVSNVIVQRSFEYGIPVMFLANVALAVTVLCQRVGDRVATAAIRWGLLLSSLGMLTAFLLVARVQRTVEDAYGNEVELGGAHGIGDPDGNGMLLTGWSTTGGDLRVPHFFGLHGIQVLILAAIALGALAARRAWLQDDRTRARIVHFLSLGYLGVFATTAVQALRGQSFAHPDAATLAEFAASAAVAACGIAWAITKARKATALPDAADEPARTAR